ncbi:hypothetical protein [Mesorhizobium sp. M0633]|uniref:hypothetical protein n=1 Tax=Mesorhizobium sp. M0633 TaxID=2956977 RepID=UPI0033394332
MSVSNDIGGLSRWRDRDIAASLLPSRNVMAIAAVTVFSIFWQRRWGTVPDTSWLITVCERMLSGERLYSQIYETNPPFSVWLYLPPVAAARLLGTAPEILVEAWTYLAVLIGLSLSGVIVKRAGFTETASLFALGPAFCAMLVVFPGNAFSEREHIGMALFMPLLALHAWRARRDAAAQPDPGLAVLAGLSGSILLLVKPYYAIMVLAPALVVAVRRRSLKSIFALEHWVIGGICVVYLSTVTLIHPEFVRDIYPLLADVYAKIGIFWPIVIGYGFSWCFLVFLIWWLWPARPGCVGGIDRWHVSPVLPSQRLVLSCLSRDLLRCGSHFLPAGTAQDRAAAVEAVDVRDGSFASLGIGGGGNRFLALLEHPETRAGTGCRNSRRHRSADRSVGQFGYFLGTSVEPYDRWAVRFDPRQRLAWSVRTFPVPAGSSLG